MTPEAIWTAVGSCATVGGIILTMLGAWMGKLNRTMEAMGRASEENHRRLQEKLDVMYETIDDRFVRKDVHMESLKRLDVEISAIHNSLNCPRNPRG
jgi:hypothetical protein